MVITSSFEREEESQRVSKSILKAEETYADKVFETNSLRPKSFQTYIGQSKLQEILRVSISAAQKRKDISSIGHILLYGPPGLGKTSCAYLLAEELKTKAHVFSAPALERAKDILGILMSASEGDIVFIDEIHRLNKITEELLYPALEDFEIDINSGKGTSSRIMRFPINKFILVGATTKLGYLSAPLRDRFTHIYRMEYYSIDELVCIIKQNSLPMHIKITDSAAFIIASCSRGTPRIANRLLRLIRDFAHHKAIELVDDDLAQRALALYRIDQSGLDSMDKKILTLLIEQYQGGPAGLETIAMLAGEDKSTIEDYYEPFLVQSGFLLRTKRGRQVTDKAINYIKQSAIASEAK